MQNLTVTLTELAAKYGCDKLHSHSYLPFYTDLLDSLKVERMLEVGVGYESLMKDFVPFYVHGASLRMWADYLPDAMIYAADIRPETLINEGRIKSFVVDQGEPESLIEMMGQIGEPLDLVIDDGSHQTKHQILTAMTLLPSVRAGGVYITEDCQEPERVVEMVGGDIYRFDKRPDDCLVVIRK